MSYNKDNSIFKNPVLDEELQDSAFRNRGGLNWNKETFVSVNYRGVKLNSIDPELYVNDLVSYWRLHEKFLWTVLGVCLLFLAMKLIA